MSGSVRVIVVDDHALVREGLVRLLEQAPNVTPVGQAATSAAAVELAHETNPEVALVDLRMPEIDGIELTRLLLEVCPDLRILILSDVESEDALLRAIRVGASGFLIRTQPFGAVAHAIDVAMDGGVALPRDLTFRTISRERSAAGLGRNAHPPSLLTSRERQILSWIAAGDSNRRIAGRLAISEHTVRAHLRNLMRKLDVSNRAQAAAVAAAFLEADAEPANGVEGR
jgi:two-component system nitrate/nitrite response regulator NarL